MKRISTLFVTILFVGLFTGCPKTAADLDLRAKTTKEKAVRLMRDEVERQVHQSLFYPLLTKLWAGHPKINAF
ncbi:MAG: hypothetical protein ABIO36_10690 [Pyrinomonadaceae bacterium]